MNSNGIPEMIRAAGKSKYRTPRPLWWGAWVAIGFLIGVVCMSKVHASPSCMTLHEARHAYPGKHLWWHPSESGRCWDDTHGRIHIALMKHNRIQSSDGGRGADRPVSYAQKLVDPLATIGSEGESPSTNAESFAGVATSPSETVFPPVIHITMVGMNFNDRWPETISTLSPLRWSQELIEFGKSSTGKGF